MFLEILVTILLGFLFMLLVLCGYLLYSYIVDDIDKREIKKLKNKGRYE
jgi:hypothetical protein